MKEFLMTTKGKIIAGAVLFAIAAIITGAVLLFSPKGGFRTIRVSELSGSAKAMHNGKEYDVYKDMKLQEGYALTTGEAGYVRMVLDEDKYIKLEENSRLIFETLGKEGSGKTQIILEYGAVTNEAATGLGEGEEYIINTPNSVLAIKGTFFRVEVCENENGEILTNVLTYGGVVKSQRILPNGEVVEENVLIEAGYKTTVSMDSAETVYVVEKVEEGKENTERIAIDDIPDGDLVDMYVASSNGHEMFIEVEEIWNVIEEREIPIEDYTSNRDGETIVPPVNNGDQDNGGENDSDSEGGHKHTEVTVTEEATCTENGWERIECSSCGEMLSEKVLEATGHKKETIIEPATETEEGLSVVKCTVCEEVFEEIIIPANHSHTYETVTIEPTCSIDGETVTRCSVCLEEKAKTVLPATGHTEDGWDREPSFTMNGERYRFCSACGVCLEQTVIPKLDPIYTDNGDIYITKDGFYTSKNPELIPYTGQQYVISQKSSNQVTCNIYCQDVVRFYTINMDGINILGSIIVGNGQSVSLYSDGRPNTITATGNNSAVKNNGGFVINFGTFSFKSSGYAIEHHGTQLAFFGGVVTVDGGIYDIYGEGTEIKGGSVRLMHKTMSGQAYIDGMEAECRVYDYYPNSEELQYMVSNGGYEQPYLLEEDEKSADGKYYIWMPKNQVRIDKYHFPDQAIRDYLTNRCDDNVDGYLLEDELLRVTEISFGLNDATQVSSLKGIEYLPNLEFIQCSNASGMTELDLSKNPNLITVHLYNALISTLDLSNNPKLHNLSLNGCVNLTRLDVSKCPDLTYLEINDTSIAYVDLSNTSVNGNNFKSSNNVYQATGMSGGTFDAKNIPGIDISKISNVTGADYDPSTGMFTNITGDQLEFVYDCGNGVFAEFALKFI